MGIVRRRPLLFGAIAVIALFAVWVGTFGALGTPSAPAPRTSSSTGNALGHRHGGQSQSGPTSAPGSPTSSGPSTAADGGSAPTASPPPPSPSAQWVSGAGTAISAAATAWFDYAAALQAYAGTGSTVELASACQQISSSIADLKALPIPPDGAATSDLQQGIAGYEQAYAQGCQGTDYNPAYTTLTGAEHDVVAAEHLVG